MLAANGSVFRAVLKLFTDEELRMEHDSMVPCHQTDSRQWCWMMTHWTVFIMCRLQKQLSNHNVVLASYDVVRNDIDFFW